MMNVRFVLQNLETFKKNCRLRKMKADFDRIQQFVQQRSELVQKVEGIRARINEISREVNKEKGGEGKGLIAEGKKLKNNLKDFKAKLRNIESNLINELRKIPNLTHPDAPVGEDDQDNVEIERIGEIPKFSFKVRDHLELGKLLDIIDFEAGARVTGSNFCFLKDEGVLLEFALLRYALEVLAENGFQLYLTPDLAKLPIIEGIGFIPRGPETQIYRIEENNLGLIATAEITLGGLLQNTIVDAKKLPLKFGGVSHCFRTEAGAYGRASKGLYRIHQFSKAEMFIYSLPEDSDKMLELLVNVEKRIFSELGIPFRIVDCCTGDLGGAAYRKFDLEAWIPSEERWGEITSASNCTDYQAQRLNIRFKQAPNKKPEFIHTLNGTAIAVSRTLLAILENYQEQDGSVRIPKVLQKFVGKDKILPKKG